MRVKGKFRRRVRGKCRAAVKTTVWKGAENRMKKGKQRRKCSRNPAVPLPSARAVNFRLRADFPGELPLPRQSF